MPCSASNTVDALPSVPPAYCRACERSTVVLLNPNSMPPLMPSALASKKLGGRVAPVNPRQTCRKQAVQVGAQAICCPRILLMLCSAVTHLARDRELRKLQNAAVDGVDPARRASRELAMWRGTSRVYCVFKMAGLALWYMGTLHRRKSATATAACRRAPSICRGTAPCIASAQTWPALPIRPWPRHF